MGLNPPLTASVIMPVHQGERFVGEALRSLLDQTRPPAEIVVVDDGCTDGSMTVVRSLADAAGPASPTVRIVHRTNGGPAAARNTGLAAANHDVIAFHDADDVALPGWLEMSLQRLETDPALTGVIGRQELVVEPGAPTPVWLIPMHGAAPGVTADHLLHHLMNMVVRRTAFDLVGTFDESMQLGEDADLVLRMTDSGLRLAFVEEVVVRRRIHHSNVTHDAAAFARAQFEVLARRVRRRKAGR